SPLQMHLDFDVDDLDATEGRGLGAGGPKYDLQPKDPRRGSDDPAGHPFCRFTLATAVLGLRLTWWGSARNRSDRPPRPAMPVRTGMLDPYGLGHARRAGAPSSYGSGICSPT